MSFELVVVSCQKKMEEEQETADDSLLILRFAWSATFSVLTSVSFLLPRATCSSSWKDIFRSLLFNPNSFFHVLTSPSSNAFSTQRFFFLPVGGALEARRRVVRIWIMKERVRGKKDWSEATGKLWVGREKTGKDRDKEKPQLKTTCQDNLLFIKHNQQERRNQETGDQT